MKSQIFLIVFKKNVKLLIAQKAILKINTNCAGALFIFDNFYKVT